MLRRASSAVFVANQSSFPGHCAFASPVLPPLFVRTLLLPRSGAHIALVDRSVPYKPRDSWVMYFYRRWTSCRVRAYSIAVLRLVAAEGCGGSGRCAEEMITRGADGTLDT